MANANFTCVLDAWRDGTTLYGRMHYYRSGSYYYSDSSFPNPTMNLGGSVYTDSAFGDRVRAGIYVGDVYSTTFSRTVSGTGTRTVTWSAGSGQRSDFAGTWSVDVGGFPGTTSPPTDLSFTGCTAGPDWYDIGVSVSGWGNGGSAAQRYIEAQVWTRSDSGLVEPRRFQASYGTMSATIRVNNSSSGSLTITPNTIYTVGIYATNGAASAGSARVGNHCSAPPVMTSTASNITETSAVLNWSFGNQGGAYSLILEYSLDGTTWNTMSTQTGSGAKSGTYTVSGLTAGTAYSIRTRIRTTNTSQANYITDGNTVSVTTYKAPNTPTVSASAYSNTQINVTYGTTSFNNPSTGTVYLYGGTGATPTTEIASKTTTGNSTYNHTSLAPNTKYYFRSRAYNGQFWSSYSSVVNATTLPSALASKSASPLSSESAKVSYSISSDGGALTKYIEYSLDNSTWQNGASITGGSSTSGYFIVSGLSADTTHTIYLRVRNSSGSTSSGNVQVTTYPAPPAAHPAFIVPTNQFGEFSLKGNTTQQTYSGKNIYKGARAFTVYDSNGIKITNDGTGALTFNGKATGNIYVNIIDNTNATTQANSKTNVVSGETYVASVAAPFPNNVIFRTNNLNYSLMTISEGATSSNSWTASATENNGLWCYVYITNGKEFNNDVLRVQVEKGTTATSYEPYVGGIASPSPDYPQTVNTVTGRQVVDVYNKNLFNYDNASQGYLGGSGQIVSNSTAMTSEYIEVDSSTAYTASANTTYRYIGIGEYTANKDYIQKTQENTDSLTITTSATTKYIRVFYNQSTNVSKQTLVTTEAQIEKGSTATPYQPHYSYEINLGKNLWGGFSADFPATSQNISYITKTGGTTQVGAGTAGSTSYSILTSAAISNNLYKTLTAGAYTISGSVNNIKIEAVKILNGSGTVIATSVDGAGATFTLTEDTDVFLRVRVDSGVTVSATTVAPMLEKGSSATTYAPYFAPIELCEIGDYQDKIYYNYGKNRIGFPSASASSSKHTLTVTGDSIITVNGGDGTGSSVTNMVTSTLFNLTSGNKRLTLIPISGDFTAGGIGISFRDSSDTQIAYQQIYYSGSGSNVTYDYTDAQVAQITKMYLYVSNAGVFNNFKFRLQLTDGTTDDPNYQPYVNVTPGWYVHKETVKLIPDSTKSWNTLAFSSATNYFYAYTGSFDSIVKSQVWNGLYSNMFITYPGDTYPWISPSANITSPMFSNGDRAVSTPYNLRIAIPKAIASTLADFKTWLDTNKPEFYYPLATFTETKITNADLVAQLEALSKSPTFGDDTNIDITSENLPLELAAIYRSSRKAVKMYAGVKAIGDFRMNGDTTQQTYSGKNLLDSSAFVGAYINSSGNIVNDSGNNNALFDYIPVSANSSYTASYNGSGTVQIQYAFFNSSKTIISRDVNFSEVTSRTVTTPASCAYIRVWFYRSPAWTQAIVNESKLQLESGSSATSFEPYVGGIPAPNPNYPQEVQTVTGRQVVSVYDRNMLNNNNPTVVANTATWTPTATGGTYSNTASWGTGVKWNMIIEEGETYTFHAEMPSYGNHIYLYLGTFTDDTYTTRITRIIGDGTGNLTQTFVADSKYLQLSILTDNSVSNQSVNNIQLEKGPSATAYQPHYSYEVNLGKNLFDGTYAQGAVGGANNNQWLVGNNLRSAIIPCEPNTTYTATKNDSSDRFLFADNPTIPTTHNQSINYLGGDNSATSYTVTTHSDARYLIVYVSASSQEPRLQIEKGSTATTYAPYFTPIELCKIGTYQDYIYKSGNDWYVHKATKKIDLSSVTWVSAQTTLKRTESNQINDIVYPSSNDTVGIGISEKYIMRVASGISAEQYLGYMGLTNNSRIIVNVGSGGADPSGYAYYVLATPTDTQITNADLIAQLEAIDGSATFGDQTALTVDGDLPADATANFTSARRILKLYGSANGTAKLVFEE